MIHQIYMESGFFVKQKMWVLETARGAVTQTMGVGKRCRPPTLNLALLIKCFPHHPYSTRSATVQVRPGDLRPWNSFLFFEKNEWAVSMEPDGDSVVIHLSQVGSNAERNNNK